MSKEQHVKYCDSTWYPDNTKNGPCFKCHIRSYGKDSLHRPFVREQDTCDHPDLVLGLAYGIWSIPELRKRAEPHLGAGQGWGSLQGFQTLVRRRELVLVGTFRPSLLKKGDAVRSRG
ncbi:hypothetical protein B0H14DRAFT_2621875 [Mycena olivaceomarginata]|nr:hypothetical protein B0H14DRAFT_2621875 [Mycena olivaceomarginata]